MAAFSLTFATFSCEAVIIYTDIEDVQVLGVLALPPLEPVGVDLNLDGEFTRFGGTDGVVLVPLGGNRSIYIPEPSPDIGNFLMPLEQGFLIGPDIDDALTWGNEGALVSACVNIGCIGFFDSLTAFIGTKFLIEGQVHYGWIQFADRSGIGGGYLLDFAYETEPGVPIVAGAVPIPEPSVYISLIIGLGVMTCQITLAAKRGRSGRGC